MQLFMFGVSTLGETTKSTIKTYHELFPMDQLSVFKALFITSESFIFINSVATDYFNIILNTYHVQPWILE